MQPISWSAPKVRYADHDNFRLLGFIENAVWEVVKTIAVEAAERLRPSFWRGNNDSECFVDIVQESIA